MRLISVVYIAFLLTLAYMLTINVFHHVPHHALPLVGGALSYEDRIEWAKYATFEAGQ